MTMQLPLSILLVDDNLEDRAVCSRCLSRHPAVAYTCIEAVTGTEGLALYHRGGDMPTRPWADNSR